MLPKRNAAFHQFQGFNSILPAGQKLPKNIIKLIGHYVQVLSPAETLLELKSILEEKLFYERLGHSNITGIDFYHLADIRSMQGLAWNFLLGDLDPNNHPRHPEQFEANLNYLMKIIFFPPMTKGRHVLHVALEKNNLDLIKVFLNLRKKLLNSAVPSNDPFSPYQKFKIGIDAYTAFEIMSFPSLLQYAAYVGDVEAYDLMIAAGGDTRRGVHPLVFAVCNTQVDFVRTMLPREQSGYLLCYTTILEHNKFTDFERLDEPKDGDGLLETALSLFDAHRSFSPLEDEMVTLLVEQGIKVRDYSPDQIDLFVEFRCKGASQAWVRGGGIDKLLTHRVDKLYALIDLVGGYDQVRELTNTAVTDPKMLTLIFLGIYSQALGSEFITQYSLDYFQQIYDQIVPIVPQACETNKGLMVFHLKHWYANKPILSTFDHNPITSMTDVQKNAWGLK